jgi:homopolymeric O-antigen transport system permease protein
VVLGLIAAVTLGTGLWFAALNVKYRDIVMVVPFITLVGLFVSPLIYPITEVPVELQPLYAINPMSGILELWRFMLLPTPWPSLSLLLIPVTISIGLLTTGLIYFRRAEPNFADLI